MNAAIMSSSNTSAMQAFLDSNLGASEDEDEDRAEEVSALSTALDDQSYHIVQHLIHELGESRTKEERIRQEFDTFRQWIKKISVPDLIKDVEVVMDENTRLLTDLHKKNCDMDRLSTEVDRLRSENYDYKMKVLSTSKRSLEQTSAKASQTARQQQNEKKHHEEVKRLGENMCHLVVEMQEMQDSLDKVQADNKKLGADKYIAEKQLREAQLEHEKLQKQQDVAAKNSDSDKTHDATTEDMEDELQDMQHMLEEAIKGKHDLKREVERLTQQILVLKATPHASNSVPKTENDDNRGRNQKSKEEEQQQKKEQVKNKARDLKRIKELEIALQDIMDDNDQLEEMLEDKCQKVDRLNDKTKDLTAQLDHLRERQEQSRHTQRQQEEKIKVLKEQRQNSSTKGGGENDNRGEQRSRAEGVPTADSIRLQAEQIQLQGDLNQLRTTADAEKGATELLMNQMNDELESMRDVAEGMMTDNHKMKERNITLMELVSACNCRPFSKSQLPPGESKNGHTSDGSLELDGILQKPPGNVGVNINGDNNAILSPNEQGRSKASARFMSLIRDRFNQPLPDDDPDSMAGTGNYHGRTIGGDGDGDGSEEIHSVDGGIMPRRRQLLQSNSVGNSRGFFGRRPRPSTIVEEGLAESNEASDYSLQGKNLSSSRSVGTSSTTSTTRSFGLWNRDGGKGGSVGARQPKKHLRARRHSWDI
jgi:hypothetical protein